MATLKLKRPQNVEGDFFVDESCIDCDTCRWMTPEVFNRQDGQSAVYSQPDSKEERLHALQALLACPTASIGTVEKPTDIKKAQESFPLQIAENVYHCGYHAESSYGAASYFIVRPEGNILVDSPRFTPPLVQQLEEMGGVSLMYLTHRDDIADHRQFAEHFSCKRVLHSDEISPKTQDVEIKLQGQDPITLAPDLLIIPVPGHTKGHTVLLYNNKFLFTGDHLAWSDSQNQLIAFRRVCWYSWSELQESMQKLTHYSFEWVLPGHGRRYWANPSKMQEELQKCIRGMKNI